MTWTANVTGSKQPRRSGQTAAGRALEVGQLLAQGEVLDHEVRAGAEGGAQRSKEAEEQGTHRVIMQDGETCRPRRLSIVATVGKHTSRMTSSRATPSKSRGSAPIGGPRGHSPQSRAVREGANTKARRPMGPRPNQDQRILIARGRCFSRRDIKTIEKIVRANYAAGRTRISQEVCRALKWTQPNGWLKERACRDVLIRLELEGHLRLPPRRVTPNNSSRCTLRLKSRNIHIDTTPINCVDFAKIQLELVRRGEAEATWNRLVAQYHYLGFEVFVGRSMKYLITSEGRTLGAIGWCDPSWAVDPRDRILLPLGYSREEIRNSGINNGRFLILPWVTVPNLASRLLGLAARRVRTDWEKFYFVRPTFLETYVDTTRYRGTSYYAANWKLVGHTKGYRKRGGSHTNSQTRKAVLLYPFDAALRSFLGHSKGGLDGQVTPLR